MDGQTAEQEGERHATRGRDDAKIQGPRGTAADEATEEHFRGWVHARMSNNWPCCTISYDRNGRNLESARIDICRWCPRHPACGPQNRRRLTLEAPERLAKEGLDDLPKPSVYTQPGR